MVTMFRCPGELRHSLRGFLYDQKEFLSEDEGNTHGWHITLDAAAGVPDTRDVQQETDKITREELEQKAIELGVKFDGRTGDNALLQRINEAMEI